MLLEMRGPEFLLVFIGLAAAVYVIVHLNILSRESGLPSAPRIRDPYAIAYLRGDTRELIRVVVLSLALRQLLTIGKMTLQTVDPAEIERAQAPIERELLRACRTACQPLSLPKVPEFRAAIDAYHRDLVDRGLLASDEVKRARRLPVYAGIGVLVALAVSKISVALSTGHSNILFLVILTFVAFLVLRGRGLWRRTPAGSDALLKLQTLFSALRRRRADGLSETTLLAAVFGIYSLAGLDRISWAKMFSSPNSSDGGGGGCGSSGGCGGGGGGCGGCGS